MTDPPLSFGSLATQEGRNVEVVAGNIAGDVSYVLLDLLNNVLSRCVAMEGGSGSGCRSRRCRCFFRLVAARFPGARHELRALCGVLLVGFLEAGGDDGDLDG